MVELANQYNFHINVIPLDTPAYLDVQNVPQDLKDAALDMIETLEKQFDPKTTPRTEHNCLCFHGLKPKGVSCASTCPIVNANMFSKFLVNIKNKINQPANEDSSKQFIEVSRLKDTYKNQSFDTLEIARYYD